MVDVFWFIVFVTFGVATVVVAASALAVFRQGPSQIRHLRRSGYGIGTLVRGQMTKPNDGSTIDVIEGLEFIAVDGRVSDVRPTRALSGETV